VQLEHVWVEFVLHGVFFKLHWLDSLRLRVFLHLCYLEVQLFRNLHLFPRIRLRHSCGRTRGLRLMNFVGVGLGLRHLHMSNGLYDLNVLYLA
jgi:hypothetical protein